MGREFWADPGEANNYANLLWINKVGRTIRDTGIDQGNTFSGKAMKMKKKNSFTDEGKEAFIH